MMHISKGRLLALAAVVTACVAYAAEEIGQNKIEKTSAAFSLDARANDARTASVATFDARTTISVIGTIKRFNSNAPAGMMILVR